MGGLGAPNNCRGERRHGVPWSVQLRVPRERRKPWDSAHSADPAETQGRGLEGKVALFQAGGQDWLGTEQCSSRGSVFLLLSSTTCHYLCDTTYGS